MPIAWKWRESGLRSIVIRREPCPALDEHFTKVRACGRDLQRARQQPEIALALHALAARVGRLELEFAVAHNGQMTLAAQTVFGRHGVARRRTIVQLVFVAQNQRSGLRVLYRKRRLARTAGKIQAVDDDGARMLGLVGERTFRLATQTYHGLFRWRQTTLKHDIRVFVNLK